MLKTKHIKIRVTKAERQLIEECERTKDTTISKALRALINQVKEHNSNEFKQA